MEHALLGKDVDGYRVQEVIGQGGMGVVYRAEDVALSRPVALKCLNRSLANDESFLRRFRSEARALAQIDSPYIVQVYTLTRLDVGLVIVMEYVEGQDLKSQVDGTGANWKRVLPLLHQMLTALEHAHAANVIHRDIKPHNILLADASTMHGNRIKMTDFGLAKVNTTGDRSRTVTEGVYGSLNYMSPEQVEGLGGVDHRSDIYSLGMTTYELLAGRLPFPEEETTYTVMRAIVEEDLPPLSDFADHVPGAVVDLVMKTLEKDPADRFQSATEMKEAVTKVIRELTGGTALSAQALRRADDAATAHHQGDEQSTGSVGRAHTGRPSRRDFGIVERLKTLLPSTSVGKTVGIVVLFIGLLCGAGYVAYDGPLNPSQGTTNRAIEPSRPPTVPSSIASLASITDSRTLKEEIDARVDDGTLIKGSSPQDFFIAPEKCYVFIIDRSSHGVKAVLDTGAVRVNLRTGQSVNDWSNRYEDHQQIWVALSRR